MTLVVAYEGDTDLPVIKKLAADAGFEIQTPLDCRGKSRLDARLAAFHRAAQGSPWFVLRDLDQDAACAGALLTTLKLPPSEWMCFRLVVRALEAWLLADAEAFARYFHVTIEQIPFAPDLEADPTRSLLNVVRRSTKPAIREGMLPRPGGGAKVGPQYESLVIEYAEQRWSVARAARRSPSLARTRGRLRALSTRWRAQ